MKQFHTVVVGLGITGLSCVRYLAQQNQDTFAVIDTREQPPGFDQLKQQFPQVAYHMGSFQQEWLNHAKRIIVSPGIALETPELQQAKQAGAILIGDIELFAQNATVNVAGITGSNGKTTVTTLLDLMMQEAKIPAYVGGNIGVPALDLLAKKDAKFFALELSSFQLERTEHLPLKIATILNLAEDHMDRYASFEDYCAAKQRIYDHAEIALMNRDDKLTAPHSSYPKKIISFGLDTPPTEADFGIIEKGNNSYLACGQELLLEVKELALLGKHNWANSLAALAIGKTLGIPMAAMIQVLKQFPGVPHRCEQVAQKNGIAWINDSKGTNVAATLTALQGMASLFSGKAILLAGGVGKNADFSPLREPVKKLAKTVIVFGQDAEQIKAALNGGIDIKHVTTLDEAIDHAAKIATSGDFVLFSPACASFDMFQDYNHRGKCFREAVIKRLG
jgi:UDP-N-acetylmuramoylalanine--D-glutamate ligase